MGVFLVRLYRGAALCWKQKRVYPNLCSPSVPSRQKKEEGGRGCGGLSVLEESHVVSESGQLLFIWNQWDWGRICWERERERKKTERLCQRGIPHCAKCHLSSIISPAVARRPQAHVFRFQVNLRHLTSPPPSDLFNNTLPIWLWEIQPWDHYNRMISCVRSTLQPQLPNTIKSQRCCGRGKSRHVRSKGEWVSVLCRACVQQMLQQHRLMITDRRTDRNLPLYVNQSISLTRWINAWLRGLEDMW